MQRNPAWLEILQIAPVVVLAAPIVVSGQVDLAALALPFTLGTLLAAVVTGIVWRQGGALNPIAVGTDVWLVLGTLGFAVGIPPLAAWLADTQGFALFLTITLVGAAFFASPFGTIGARGDADVVRSRSAALLGLIVLATAWAWWFRTDVRLGGGLPFIVCNMVRRVAIHKSPPPRAR